MRPDKKLLVIRTGSTFPDTAEALGDFEDWIKAGLALPPDLVEVVDAELGNGFPGPETVLGAVISGAHAMVTDEPDWSLGLERWVRVLVKARVPVLGICYGHQVLARAMGGAVAFHPRGTEIGTVEIRCLPASRHDPLFKALPPVFRGHVVHFQTVVRLPENAVLLAQNEFEPHHGFRVGDSAWGVQFHPEFSADAVREYLRHMEDAIRNQGQDPDNLRASVSETPCSADLLRRFGRLALRNPDSGKIFSGGSGSSRNEDTRSLSPDRPCPGPISAVPRHTGG